MDFLIDCYSNKFVERRKNIFDDFSRFYALDLTPIEFWLKNQYNTKIIKDDIISNFYRQAGNRHYVQKDLKKSLQLYTKSLCYATFNGKEYGLALANRSAVMFEIKEYENCIRDIELCLCANYPRNLTSKIYLRQATCYLELGLKENVEKCIKDAVCFLSDENTAEKEKLEKQIKEIKSATIRTRKEKCKSDITYNMPQFHNGENPNFAYASSKITMAYHKDRGRHVVACKNIQRGEVLFIEKAFVFAPVFNENKELNILKCYNCLKDTTVGVPCIWCILCVYCNEDCRKISWEQCHQWECAGMQANIWFNIGIGFPAFKAVLKGMLVSFRAVEDSYEADIRHFGDKENNYPFFNRLMSNFGKTKTLTPYIVISAVIVTYLRTYTEFFSWFLKQNNCPRKDLQSLVTYIGGLISTHIAQLSCNSSIIEHWQHSMGDLHFPETLVPVACGIFPSVSMMNHSCRPNITNYFICDTIVVKSSESLKENDEIFNCYGIDYRAMNREQRQKACKDQYYFKCKCLICSNPSKEVLSK